MTVVVVTCSSSDDIEILFKFKVYIANKKCKLQNLQYHCVAIIVRILLT